MWFSCRFWFGLSLLVCSCLVNVWYFLVRFRVWWVVCLVIVIMWFRCV